MCGLRAVLGESSDETEGKYLAEIPALPGCRAWGDTAAQVLESIQCVASAFIESYLNRGRLFAPISNKCR